MPLEIDPAWVAELRATQPELPAARVERFIADYGLSRADAAVLGSSGALAGFYEEVVAAGAGAKPAANWTMGEYLAHLNAAGLDAGHGHVTAERLAKLVRLVEDGTVSTSAAKEVFARMIEERAEPEATIEKYRLGQISDTSELEAIVAEVVAANPAQVGAVPRRQAAGHRVLRRPGDEGQWRARQPAGRERPAAARPRRLTRARPVTTPSL